MSEPVNTRRHDQSYLESEIRRLDQQSDLHWEDHHRSHLQAESSLNHRLDSVNELRGQLSDVIATMAPKSELNALRASFEQEMKTMHDLHYKLEADMIRRFEETIRYIQSESKPGRDLKTSQGAVIAAILFAITVLGAAILLIDRLGV